MSCIYLGDRKVEADELHDAVKSVNDTGEMKTEVKFYKNKY